MSTKRLFAALHIPCSEEFNSSTDELKKLLSLDKISWCRPGQVHLTVHFFGETDEEKLPEISSILNEAASKHDSFILETKGLSCFGSKYAPDIIRIQINENQKLYELKQSIDKSLGSYGYKIETTRFVPHLTIGRIKKIKDINYFWKVIHNFKNKFKNNIYVNNFYLYESKLNPDGAIHNIINTYFLKSPDNVT